MPDAGVTSSFLRGRTSDCETASKIIRKTKGVAEDGNADLAHAADGWQFTSSLDELQNRWEALNNVVEQADIAHHHTSGMARGFDVSSSSDEMTVRS